MSLTPSQMVQLGTQAPSFNLPDTDGNTVSLKDFEGAQGLLVMFICNHCPFVVHLREALAQLSIDYEDSGLKIVAISSNDAVRHPSDGPIKMKEEREQNGYRFPYLFDEDQSVAKAYEAACTPDFFLFDKSQKLAYRGQFDNSRPGNGKAITGADLRAAMDSVLRGEAAAAEQVPSIGCNIKWKPGNAPSYFG